MNVKKLTRKMMCMLLTVVMLFTNTGMTALAAEESMLNAERSTEDTAKEDNLMQEAAEEKTETETLVEAAVNDVEEEDTQEAEHGDPVETDSIPQTNNVEEPSDVERESDIPYESDAPNESRTVENNSIADENESSGADESSSVDESGAVVVSGSYENITWSIDTNGKLMVTGTGNFSPDENETCAPWYEYREQIISAEVNVSGMKKSPHMFSGCSNLKSVDLTNLDTSQIVKMKGMFKNCSSLERLDLSYFDTQKTQSMNDMFRGCANLKSITFGSLFDTSKVTTMGSMFRDCGSLTTLDLSGFDTGNVTTMNSMFWGCSNLAELDLSKFDTRNVTGNLNNMFWGCSSLKSLDLSSFHTENVTSVNSMFNGCSSLTSVNLSSFNTENMTSMNSTFKNCSSLTGLDLSSFNTTNVTDMSAMFSGCTSLTDLDLSKFDAGKVTIMENMFGTENAAETESASVACDALKMIQTPYNVSVAVVLPEGDWYDGEGTTYSELPTNTAYSVLLAKGEKPQITTHITASKAERTYYVGDSISLDDLQVTYYSADGATRILESSEYTTNIDEIDTSNAGEKILTITYNNGSENLTVDVKLTVIYIGGTYENIMWSIDRNGKLLVEGTGDYASAYTSMCAPWYAHRGKIISAEVKVSGITGTGYMFNDCVNMESIDLSGFDMSAVTSVSKMLNNCNTLTTIKTPLNLSQSIALPSDSDSQISWYDPEGTMYTELPRNQSSSILLTKKERSVTWDIDTNGKLTVTGTGDFVPNNYWYTDIPWYERREEILSAEINLTDVTNARYMFYGCSNLKSVDFKNFDISRITNLDCMFYNCTALMNLDLSGFDMCSVTYADGMIDECDALTTIKTPKNLSISVSLPSDSVSGWYDADGNKYTELPTGKSSSILLTKKENITWDIDENGKLTVTGTGDFASRYHSYAAIPWYERREEILSAEINLTGATDIGHMFYKCSNLKSVNFKNFDTSQITNMRYLFYDCSSLADLDLSNFDTGNVTEMQGMFYRCSSLVDLDLSSFDMSSVTDAGDMFYDCSALTTMKTPCNISVSVELPTVQSYGDEKWSDADNNIYTELPKDRSDSILLKLKISGTYNNITWSIEDGKLLAEGTGNYKIDKGRPEYSTPWGYYREQIQTAEIKIQNMTATWYMFYGCKNLTSVDFSGFDASQVTDMMGMFYGCSSLTDLDLSGFNGGDMGRLLIGCDALTTLRTPRNVSDLVVLPTGAWCDAEGNAYTELPVKRNDSILLTKKEAQEAVDSGTYKNITWSIDADGKLLVEGTGDFTDDTSATRAPWYGSRAKIKSAKVKVTGMKNASYMFFGCEYMTDVDLSEFDTSQVTNMDYMFGYCKGIERLDLSSFDTGKVTTAKHMFYNCSGMKVLNLKGIDFGAVSDMSYMFYNCTALNNINLSEFKTDKATDMSYMFYNCNALKNMDLSSFNTENVKNMKAMFNECSSLYDLDLSGFDTKNVTDMSSMFSYCENLDSVDLSSFNTENVTDMSSMFMRCTCLNDLKLDSFDTKNVTDMFCMFYECYGLINLDLSGFHTENVKNMSGMFCWCESLRDLNVSKFNTANVTDMSGMFSACPMLTDLNVSSFNTEKVTDMSYMFMGCTGLTSLDLSGFNAGNAIYMDEMLQIWLEGGATNLLEIRTPYNVSASVSLPGEEYAIWYDSEYNAYTELPKGKSESVLLTMQPATRGVSGVYKGIKWSIDEYGNLLVEGTGDFAKPFSDEEDKWRAPWNMYYSLRIKTAKINVQGMTDASYMFYECHNLRSVDFSGFDTSQVTNMQGMFAWCTNLTNLDLSSFSTENVTNMSHMFYDCHNLLELDLSSFQTDNVTDMSDMFYNCRGLTSLNFSGFHTEKVTNMSGMFGGEGLRLTELDLSSFQTDNVTNMSDMFGGCYRLTELDLSSFQTDNVTNMTGMFRGCSRLKKLNLSSFNMENVTELSDNMLYYCDSLTTIYTPLYLSQAVALPEGMWYDVEENTYIELPTGKSTSILLTKDKKPEVVSYIMATKTKIIYTVGDTINTDDLQIKYYGTDGSVRPLENTECTTNAAVIDMSTAGEKILTITYQNGTEILTVDIKLTVLKNEESDKDKEEDKDDSSYTDEERSDLTSVNAAIAAIKSKVYDGNAYEPVVKVTATVDGKKTTLTEGADYRVLYQNNTNAGEGKVIVKGNGIYKGQIDKTFTINPKPMKKLKVVTGNYVGVVSPNELATLPVYVYDGARLLEIEKDYKLSQCEEVKKSAWKVTVESQENSNYTGSVIAKFTVYESGTKVINPENVTLDKESVPYTGKAVKDVKPIVTVDNVTLTEKTHYKVQYQNNKDAGTAFVIVTGKGEYKGKVVVPFTIKADESPLTVKVKNVKAHSGKLQKPAVTVTVTKDGKAKKLGKKDYTITYKNNFHAGDATVTVTGKGNYAGLKQTATFTIKQQEIKKVSIKGTKENLVITYSKRKLKEGADYTIQYGETKKNKIEVIIKGTDTGDFSGEVKKYVKIQ